MGYAMEERPRRIVLSGWATPGETVAARILDQSGAVVGVVLEPVRVGDAQALRDAVIDAALETDFGDVVLAGVAFASHLGGDAVGFT